MVTTSTNGHLGDDGAPPLGSLAQHRALQQPAGAQPAACASRVPSTTPVQPVGHREVVGEGVLLVLQVPVEPPPSAPLAAAADVGVGEDHAAVEQARQRRVPLGLDRRPRRRRTRRAARARCRPAGCPGGAPASPAPACRRGTGSVRVSQRYVRGSWPGASLPVALGALAGGQVDVATTPAARRRTRRPR